MISTIFEIFVRHLDFPIPKIDHAINYAHWKYNCASENVHTDMLYLGLNWLFFHSHIRLKVYDHGFTLDIHEKLSRLSTRVLWDLEKNDEEKWYLRVIWDNLTPSIRTQALMKIISDSNSLRWVPLIGKRLTLGQNVVPWVTWPMIECVYGW